MPGNESTQQAQEKSASDDKAEQTNQASTKDEKVIENNNPEQFPKNQTNQKTRSGDLISPIGDNSHITINTTNNYYGGIVRDAARYLSSDEEEDNDDKDIYRSKEDIIKKNLAFGRHNIPQFDDILPQELKELPEGSDSLSRWYYALTEYEQCYVQAAAILHGVSAHEISKRADQLYKIIQGQKEPDKILDEKSPQQKLPREQTQDSVRLHLRRQSSLVLREHTHTTTRRVNGGARVFWQDVDNYGLSKFGSHVLTFLAQEFISQGEHGESFFNVVQSWSQERKGEYYWRAARALGAILWYKDTSQLRDKATEWGKQRQLRGQRRAASLLDGAQEIEIANQKDHDNNTQNPLVLELLDEWVDKAQKEPNNVSTNLGCSAANAYALIGKKSPDIALQGLGKLLALQQSEETTGTSAISAAVVSAYVSLIWSSHMRNFLKHLANIAEQLVLQWSPPQALEKCQVSRLQRKACLGATFEAFFLAAFAALPQEQEQDHSPDIYTRTLSTPIMIPDPHKRDVLLVVILTEDPARGYLLTLLSAAIVSLKGKTAFELIRQWADTVLDFQDPPNVISKQLYRRFVQFMVELGKKIDVCCRTLTDQTYRTPAASEAYKNKLEQWHKEGLARKRAIGELAYDVLTSIQTKQNL